MVKCNRGVLTCFLILNQLSESEESDNEAEGKTEKKAAHSSGRKYIPPKIAAVHYGNVIFLFFHVSVMKKKHIYI